MNGNIATQNKNLNSLIRRTVIETLQEILADPDYGLALRQNFVKRLEKSVQSKKAGRVVAFDKILKKYQK